MSRAYWAAVALFGVAVVLDGIAVIIAAQGIERDVSGPRLQLHGRVDLTHSLLTFAVCDTGVGQVLYVTVGHYQTQPVVTLGAPGSCTKAK